MIVRRRPSRTTYARIGACLLAINDALVSLRCMADAPDNFLERAKAKLADLRQEQQRLEERKQKIDQDLSRLAVVEGTLLDLLGSEAGLIAPAASPGSSARTQRRLDCLQQILAAAGGPMTPKDLLLALEGKLGKDEAGSRAALQDLLRRSDLFKNVDRGMWALANPVPTKRAAPAAQPDKTTTGKDGQQGEVDYGDIPF